MTYAVSTLLLASKNAAINRMLLSTETEASPVRHFPCGKIKSTSLLPATLCGSQEFDKTTLCGDCYALFQAIESRSIEQEKGATSSAENSKELVKNQLYNYIKEYNDLKTLVRNAKFKNKREYQIHQAQLRKIQLYERVIPFIKKCIESNVAKNLDIASLEKLINSTEIGLFDSINFSHKLPVEFSHENLIGAATAENDYAMSIYFKYDNSYSRIRLVHPDSPLIDKDFSLLAIKSDIVPPISEDELVEFVLKNGTLVEKDMVDIKGFSLYRYYPTEFYSSNSRSNKCFIKELSENGLKLIYQVVKKGFSNSQLLQLFDGLGFSEIKLPRSFKINHGDGRRELFTV